MKIIQQDKNFQGHLALFATNIIFGLNTPITKTLLGPEALTPFALMFLRLVSVTVLLWSVSLFVRRERVPARDLAMLFFASIFGLQLNQVSFFVGLSLTSPVDASIVTTTVPMITMLLAALFLREPITFKKVAGVLIGAAGALWLVLANGHGGDSGSSMKGILFCLLSSASFAVYLTLFKPVIRRYSPVTLMKWMFLFASLCSGPLCWPDVRATDFAAFPWDVYARIGYVVILATLVTYLLIPYGQQRLRPTVVSMYNYLQPLVTSLVAVAFGMGTLGWNKLAAALLIFAGVYVVTISKSREQLESERADSQETA